MHDCIDINIVNFTQLCDVNAIVIVAVIVAVWYLIFIRIDLSGWLGKQESIRVLSI